MWGQAWYLPLCLLTLPHVTVWVWAAWGFPHLGGENQLHKELSLHMVSLAGEQHHVGTESPLLPGSTEIADVCTSSQL